MHNIFISEDGGDQNRASLFHVNDNLATVNGDYVCLLLVLLPSSGQQIL